VKKHFNFGSPSPNSISSESSHRFDGNTKAYDESLFYSILNMLPFFILVAEGKRRILQEWI